MWAEILTNRDLNLDGVVGEPKPAPNVIPSTSWAEEAEAAAIKLWDYTHSQLRAAEADGRQLKVKPWARRQGHGLTHDEWDSAIDVWVAGELVKDRSAKELNATSYKRGLDCIRQGMATLNFIRMREKDKESWLPR